MSLTDALDRYFAAWNDHDPEAVVRSLADGGSYEDPMTGGPLTGDALAATVATLLAGFPDLHFDLVSVAPTSDTTAAAQWLMRGTNTGPMPAGPATGQTVALAGADFIDYDPVADRIAKVTGYFDTAAMLTQLGLQAHLTPADNEPVTKYGVGLRVDTQRQAIPGAFSVTWLDIDPEHQVTLIDAVTSVVTEQLGNNGYLGSCGLGTLNLRMPNVQGESLGTREEPDDLAGRPRDIGGERGHPTAVPSFFGVSCRSPLH